MDVKQIEHQFRELSEQWEAGTINDEQFAAEVNKLQFQDKQGQLWGIDASTGQWHYEKEGHWERGAPPPELMPIEPPKKPLPKPPDEPVSPPTPLPIGPPPPSPLSRVWPLAGVAFIVIVLIIACILASPVLIPWLVRPTTVASVTKTAAPLSTATPAQVATDAPSSTATPAQMPTDTPSSTVPPAPGPTDTSSPIPTATTTFTPIPTNTPPPTPTASATLTPMPKPPAPESLTPKPPTIAGKIAFPVFDPQRGTYDIFIANAADGSGRERIKEEASQPCLSPDGTEITYRSWRSNKRGLKVAHTFGDDIWAMTDRHEASRPSVSRGGTAFHCKEPDRPVHIYLHPGGGEPQVVRYGAQHEPISGESPSWVSGERLVYKGCVGTVCGLYLTDGVYDGTGLIQLTYNTSDTNPEASPDGKKVAFMSRRDGNWEIYVMEDLVAHGPVKRLTTKAANDGLPIWSPDGRTIAFASDRSGEWAVWAMNPDGSNQQMLFPLGGSLHGYVRDAPLHERGGWEEERLSWVP